MQIANCLEVYTPDNTLLFRVMFVEKKQLPRNNGNGSNGSNQTGRKGNRKDDPITEPQTRMLFRLMAEIGKVGDEALEELKGIFDVDNLKDISKFEASKKIEELLQHQNGG